LITFFFVTLVLIEELFPLFFIIVEGGLEVSKVREDLNDLRKGRNYDEVYEADLTFSYIRRASIVKLSHRELMHRL